MNLFETLAGQSSLAYVETFRPAQAGMRKRLVQVE
jgi:hypothetical protein